MPFLSFLALSKPLMAMGSSRWPPPWSSRHPHAHNPAAAMPPTFLAPQVARAALRNAHSDIRSLAIADRRPA
jgi:hypothetical protein